MKLLVASRHGGKRERSWTHQVSEQVVRLQYHVRLQLAGRHGNHHQLEAAQLQKKKDGQGRHGPGSKGSDCSWSSVDPGPEVHKQNSVLVQ